MLLAFDELSIESPAQGGTAEIKSILVKIESLTLERRFVLGSTTIYGVLGKFLMQ
jgi:hypothetical protein